MPVANREWSNRREIGSSGAHSLLPTSLPVSAAAPRAAAELEARNCLRFTLVFSFMTESDLYELELAETPPGLRPGLRWIGCAVAVLPARGTESATSYFAHTIFAHFAPTAIARSRFLPRGLLAALREGPQ